MTFPRRGGIASVLLAGLTVAGCTQYWAKPGGTPSELEATKAVCERQSFAEFPPMPQQVMVGTGYVTPMQTSCTAVGYTTSCVQTGGQFIPPSYALVDQNQGARQSAVRACLYQAGWQPARNKEEAEAIMNSRPPGAAGNPPGGGPDKPGP
jgi:hypothetical protein